MHFIQVCVEGCGWVWVWVCTSVQVPEGIRSPGAGAAVGYELPDRCARNNSGSVQEQYVLLTAVISPMGQRFFFFKTRQLDKENSKENCAQ